MSIQIINPESGEVMQEENDVLKSASGFKVLMEKGVFRFVKDQQYSENFGFQWNEFQKTQLDKFSGTDQSFKRFFRVTDWTPDDLKAENILEVGSGAGRFTQIMLDHTKANVYSIDRSIAVEANFGNNGPNKRLKLFQADIYALPFKPGSFDRVICFGVLQHTPDVKRSVKQLIDMVKPGGELIVDFYPLKGWWTKWHVKYFLRPYTRNMSNERLLKRIKSNIGWMLAFQRFFINIGLNSLTSRLIPMVNLQTFPKSLAREKVREWAVLDTFDMFSARYDQPQKLSTVEKWFKEFGMQSVQANYISFGKTKIACVKGRKPS